MSKASESIFPACPSICSPDNSADPSPVTTYLEYVLGSKRPLACHMWLLLNALLSIRYIHVSSVPDPGHCLISSATQSSVLTMHQYGAGLAANKNFAFLSEMPHFLPGGSALHNSPHKRSILERHLVLY